ncbi:MAG TPA: cytidylate kinase-like family protein [Candidatus Acidoferrales bacterium]|nr:cytidylate kinase-like family protein [Candidatus Acidoferrales bacterium]
MPIRIITIEREYGSGGAMIALRLARRLGWKLWDEELSAEIARVANVAPEAVRRRDEQVDSLLTRLFKVFARGSYERALPVSTEQLPDTDWMVAALHKVVESAASRGNCVIVGRGSPYILRHRDDAFHVFVYAPREEKIKRVMSIGKSEKEARQLIEEIDRERASFIRHYFGKEWPHRPLYHLMMNSKCGDEFVVETILRQIAAIEAAEPSPKNP